MIEIFLNEQKDGLSDYLINTSIAYSLDLLPLKNIILAETFKWTSTASYNQPDLFYLDSILATLGWNLNDDIFLKEEVIAAKDTPVDKPFNMMHQQEDIIGHMTSSRLLDSQYNISDNESFEHIAVSSVIYRAWRDEKKQEQIEKTIAEILDGKWKVSMECLFDRFDYGLITPEGKQIIVPRTPETSYLTKYLRAYKGPGVVNNNKIGRVLRKITFCGKGLVDDPGNPYSIIFNKSKKFFGAKASNIKELLMNELEMAKAELDKAKTELETVKAEIQKTAEAKWQSAIAEKENTIKSQSETIAGLQSDIKKLNDNISSTQAKLEATEAIKEEVVKGLESTKAELDKIKAEAILAARKTALSKVVSEERVEALLTKFSSASDEMFNELVSTLANMNPKEDKEKADCKAEKEDVKEEKKADLAKAELDKEIPGHSTAAKKTDEDMKSIVEFMTTNSRYSSLNTKAKEEK